MKIVVGTQEGYFQIKDRRYQYKRIGNTQREHHMLYDESDILVCSVYIQYKGMIGAMKKGGYTEEFYGDYQLFTAFNDYLTTYRSQKAEKEDRPVTEVWESMFCDRYNRQSEGFVHTYLDSQSGMVEEHLVINDGEVEIKYETTNAKSKSPKKLEDINYKAINTTTDDEHLVRKITPLEIIMRKRDLSWQDNKDYRVITSDEEFLTWVKEELDPCNGIIGFDTETEGLQINRFSGLHAKSHDVVGLVFSTADNTSVYLPLKHKRFPNLTINLVQRELRPYMCRKHNDTSKLKQYVTHNGSFDGKVMMIWNYTVNIVHDTLIISFMLNPKLGRNKGLKHLTDKYLGIEMIELDDFFGTGRGKGIIRFDLLPLESVRRYACPDADNTRMLMFMLLEELKSQQLLIYGQEIRLMSKVAEMEFNGFRVNMDKVRSEKEKAKARADEIETEIYNQAGGKFDIRSNKQLADVLFNKLGYEPLRYSEKTHEPAVDEATLKFLMKQDNDNEKDPKKLPGLILGHRKALNLISKFFDKIIEDEINSFIFPKYNQAGTDTGRFSSSNPNIQQTSRGIREIFVPEDDYYFIIVDYSQVEYRILAGMAQEYDLIEQMQDPEADVHSLTASIMFNVPVEFVDSAMRKKGKEINFGSVYGMGVQSLAIRVFGAATPETLRQAKELYETYFQRLPNITRFFNNVIERARLDNFVGTYFNRLRPLESINSLDSGERSFDERRCKNTPIQGTAADVIKIAHNRLDDRLKREGMDARVVGSVHDELICMVHKTINPWQFIRIAREEMELKIDKFPPLFIGINVATTWADGKNDGLEIPVQVSDKYIEEVKQGMHTVPYENPKAECQRIIQSYQSGRIKGWSSERGLRTRDEMMADNQIKGVVDKYFYGVTDVLDAIINDAEVYVELTEEMVYRSEKDDDARASQAFDEGRFADGLVDLEDGDTGEQPGVTGIASISINEASTRITDDYSVAVIGGSVFLKLNSPTADLIAEIKEYLKPRTVEVGANVFIMTGGKLIPTPYKLYHVNRVELLDIIEKHEIMYLRKMRGNVHKPFHLPNNNKPERAQY
ncbi:DNA polymerase [Paenibacillus pabuli]|uniref:DNA polymerase n=1 Tax=Paenibacillus pabuli TaxID=1472 RepID=UPI0032421BE5